MADKPLTESQQSVLDLAVRYGQLDRWAGGWWTYPGCPVSRDRLSAFRGKLNIPTWSAPGNVFQALVKGGFLALDGRDEHGFPTVAVPTEKAKSLCPSTK